MNILITGIRAPAALHLAALLKSKDVHITGADTIDLPLSRKCPWLDAREVFPSPTLSYDAFREWLTSAIQRFDVIIPTCEEVFFLREASDAANILAPSFRDLRDLHSKITAIDLAYDLGICAPYTERQVLDPAGDPANSIARAGRIASDDLVFTPNGTWPLEPRHTVQKPIYSRFATSTRIAPEKLRHPDIGQNWVLQEYLPGQEVSATAFAMNGEIRGCVTYRSRYRAGQGAGIFLEPILEVSDATPGLAMSIEDIMARLCRKVGYSGFIGADFILYGVEPHLIEVNPRITSGVHFFRSSKDFRSAFFSDGRLAPVSKPQAMKTALALFHPVKSIFDGELRRLRRHSFEATAFRTWSPGPMAQLATAAQLSWAGARQRMSPLRAATVDIAWDGPSRGAALYFAKKIEKPPTDAYLRKKEKSAERLFSRLP